MVIESLVEMEKRTLGTVSIFFYLSFLFFGQDNGLVFRKILHRIKEML